MSLENSLNVSSLLRGKFGAAILLESTLNAYLNQLVPQEETEKFSIKVFSFSIGVNEWCEQRQNPHSTAHKVSMGWSPATGSASFELRCLYFLSFFFFFFQVPIFSSACHTITLLNTSPLGTMKPSSVWYTWMEMTLVLHFLRKYILDANMNTDHVASAYSIMWFMFILFFKFSTQTKTKNLTLFSLTHRTPRLYLWTPEGSLRKLL